MRLAVAKEQLDPLLAERHQKLGDELEEQRPAPVLGREHEPFAHREVSMRNRVQKWLQVVLLDNPVVQSPVIGTPRKSRRADDAALMPKQIEMRELVIRFDEPPILMVCDVNIAPELLDIAQSRQRVPRLARPR